MPEPPGERAVEVGLATATRAGEEVSGDVAVVEDVAAGTLVAVVDGAGHGPRAHQAARAAADAIHRAREHELPSVVEHCHRALQGTRGAAVSLVLVSPRTQMLTWVGVGAVEGRLLGGQSRPATGRASLLLCSGTLGLEAPDLAPVSLEIQHGDLVVLATDGVHRDFGDGLDPTGSAREVAARILAAHRIATDDAVVAVARYVETRA